MASEGNRGKTSPYRGLVKKAFLLVCKHTVYYSGRYPCQGEVVHCPKCAEWREVTDKHAPLSVYSYECEVCGINGHPVSVQRNAERQAKRHQNSTDGHTVIVQLNGQPLYRMVAEPGLFPVSQVSTTDVPF